LERNKEEPNKATTHTMPKGVVNIEILFDLQDNFK
jgi:hypothetical protein